MRLIMPQLRVSLDSAVEAASVLLQVMLEELALLTFSLLLQVLEEAVPALTQSEQHHRELQQVSSMAAVLTKSTSSPRKDLLP